MRPIITLAALIAFTLTHAQWAYAWAQQTTSPNIEQANNCAVSADGHAAMVGSFQQDLQVGTYSGDGMPCNGTRGFVALYDANGTFNWAHAISGWHPSGADTQVRDVVIDQDDNVIVGGAFSDSLMLDGLKVLSKPDSIVAGARCFYVLKFGLYGGLTWAKAIGLEGYTGQLQAIAVDGNGDIYTAGSGGFDYGRFHKLSGTDGHIIFSETPQGASAVLYDVATDPSGNVYISGQATNAFTMGGGDCPYNNALGAGSTPLFVGKFNSAGEAQWYYVPDQTGSGYPPFPENSLAVNTSGQVFVETRKTVRILGDTIADGNGAIHGLFSLDSNGQPLWARKLNLPNGQLFASDLHCDNDGNVLVAGHTYGSTVDLLDTVINSSSAGFNVFLGRYAHSTGALTGLLNGPALQDVMGVGVDGDNVPYLGGTAAGPVQLGGTEISGSWNAFVTKLGSNVGLQDLAQHSRLRAWPNPTTGAFTLQLPRASSPWQVTITDELGRVVSLMRASSNVMSIDLSGHSTGVYHVIAQNSKVREHLMVTVE